MTPLRVLLAALFSFAGAQSGLAQQSPTNPVPVAVMSKPETSKAIDQLIKGSYNPTSTTSLYQYSHLTQLLRAEAADAYRELRQRNELFKQLQKTGHLAYQQAIRYFIHACEQAITLRHEIRAETTEIRDAAKKYREFESSMRRKPTPGGADLAILNQLAQQKTKAEAYYRRREKLQEAADKAWNDGLEAKLKTDEQP